MLAIQKFLFVLVAICFLIFCSFWVILRDKSVTDTVLKSDLSWVVRLRQEFVGCSN